MSGKRTTWFLIIAILVLLVLALNFLSFHAAQSNTSVEHTLGTARAGETLPENMAPGSHLYYVVRGEEALAADLRTALKGALEALPNIDTATDISGMAQEQRAPLLLVELTPDRLWTPVYARASVSALVYFADDGAAPWPVNDPINLDTSPAVKASGEFTLTDSSWGLISKPAYSAHLADALAQRIATALQDDVYKDPSSP